MMYNYLVTYHTSSIPVLMDMIRIFWCPTDFLYFYTQKQIVNIIKGINDYVAMIEWDF